MFDGSVTDVEPLLLAPGASPGMLRAPPRSTSRATDMLSRQQLKPVGRGPAPPPPWFAVVSVTMRVEPAPAVDGTVKDETTKSPPSATARAAVLFPSCVSATVLSASALGIT